MSGLPKNSYTDKIENFIELKDWRARGNKEKKTADGF